MGLKVHDCDVCKSRASCQHRSELTKVANCISGIMHTDEAKAIYGLSVEVRCGWFHRVDDLKNS